MPNPNEPAVASITLDQELPVALGDTVTFTCEIPKLPGWAEPRVRVSAYQDVNEDGEIDTALSGANPDVVYGDIDPPDTPFTLGGFSSPWKERGGRAKCRADLVAFGHKGSVQEVLASTEFDAEG